MGACAPPSVWPAIPGAVTCHGQCTKARCCLDPTTTPMPTTTTLATDTTQKYPVHVRKYSDEQDAIVQTVVASKDETNAHSWILFAFFATAGLAVMAVLFAVMAGVPSIPVYRPRGPRTQRYDTVSPEDGLV